MTLEQEILLNVSDLKWIHCNYCNTQTHHQMLASHRSFTWVYRADTIAVNGENDEDEGNRYIEFRLWTCLGCDTCLMQVVYHQGEPLVTETEYIPPRQSYNIVVKEFDLLPSKLVILYQEVVHSFNHNVNTLCAVGIGALLAGICADKGVKGRTLAQKMGNLTEHHLSPNIIEQLLAYHFIGSGAVHKLDAPTQPTLKQCIEVLEDLLNCLYQVEHKVSAAEALETSL